MIRSFSVLVFILLIGGCKVFPSPSFNPAEIRHYTICRTQTAPVIDGKMDVIWENVPVTSPFVDIEGSTQPAPRLKTEVRMLWDDQNLYLLARLEEPHLCGWLTTRDTVIFDDNDFEVFIDPDGDNLAYAELEINTLNTVWDLFLPSPYRDSGKPINSWNIEGLQTAVNLEGTLNDNRDTDHCWTVEMAIPFRALALCSGTSQPPRSGGIWKMNFSRVEWDYEFSGTSYRKISNRPEHNWVWSPTGIIAIHHPERWGEVRFSADPPGSPQTIVRDPLFEARAYLHTIYHAQGEWFNHHQAWANSLDELPLPPRPPALSEPLLTFKTNGYEVSLRTDETPDFPQKVIIRSNGHFFAEPIR